MKNQIQLLVLMAFAATGCITLENNAFKVVGTTAHVVDAAMNGWGDYVRAGKATPADQATVKAAYEKYQQAMQTTHVAISAYQVSKDKTALNAALDVLDACKNDLVDLIQKRKL